MGKVRIFRDKKGEWRFSFIANNGKIVAVSEGYKRKGSIKKALYAIYDICECGTAEIDGELIYDYW